MDSNYSWKDYCLTEGYEIDLNKYFVFSLKNDAKILTINSCKQLDELPEVIKDGDKFRRKVSTNLDFEKLSEEYDAIEVFINKKDDLYFQLWSWDCESILIMNPDIIISEN